MSTSQYEQNGAHRVEPAEHLGFLPQPHQFQQAFFRRQTPVYVCYLQRKPFHHLLSSHEPVTLPAFTHFNRGENNQPEPPVSLPA